MLGISRFSISKQIQYWFYLPIILRNGDGRSLLSWLVQIPFEPSLPSSKQPTKTTGKPMESGVDHFPKDPWIFFFQIQRGPTWSNNPRLCSWPNRRRSHAQRGSVSCSAGSHPEKTPQIWNGTMHETTSSAYIYICVCVCACMNKTIVYVYTPVICVLYIYIWNLIACMYLFLCLRRGMPYDVHVWSKRYTICQCSFTNVLNTHFRSAFNSFKTCVIPTHYTTELHTITFW